MLQKSDLHAFFITCVARGRPSSSSSKRELTCDINSNRSSLTSANIFTQPSSQSLRISATISTQLRTGQKPTIFLSLLFNIYIFPSSKIIIFLTYQICDCCIGPLLDLEQTSRHESQRGGTSLSESCH